MNLLKESFILSLRDRGDIEAVNKIKSGLYISPNPSRKMAFAHSVMRIGNLGKFEVDEMRKTFFASSAKDKTIC